MCRIVNIVYNKILIFVHLLVIALDIGMGVPQAIIGGFFLFCPTENIERTMKIESG
jgi:hypothetical protein